MNYHVGGCDVDYLVGVRDMDYLVGGRDVGGAAGVCAVSLSCRLYCP